MIPKETLDRIVELGVDATEITLHDKSDGVFVVLPSQTKVEDVSKFFAPKFVKQSVQFIDADSFTDYVNLFKTNDTLLFAAVTDIGCTIKAVIDYHTAKGVANRCAHAAVFATRQTPEWVAWLEANRRRMSQASFAEWLEEHENLFRHPESKPTGAELKELVLTLEGKQDVRFVSAMRLENQTNRLNYEEDVTLKGQPTTKSQSVDLPRTIVAGISPFEGAPPYKVEARFKYTIQSRKLELWFETIDIHKIVRDCVKATVKQVAEKTSITPLLGSL